MGKFSIFRFLRDQWTNLPPVEHADLSRKTVVVIGFSAGLGLEATRHFARMKPGRLILGCRDLEKGHGVLAEIRDSTGYAGGELWPVDLMDFTSISAFANMLEKEGIGHIDLLVLNAAVSREEYVETKDGYESVLQTNHLGTAMVALLLLPHLLSTSVANYTPRLVITSSEGHFWTSFTGAELASPKILEKLNEKDYCTPKVMGRRYFMSKMLNIMFVRAITARLPSTSPLVVNAVNPGFCKSELTRELDSILVKLMLLTIARSTEVGSRTIVHAAVGNAEDPRTLHGRYLNKCQVEEESDYILSEEGQAAEARIWTETLEILGRVDSRITSVATQYLQS